MERGLCAKSCYWQRGKHTRKEFFSLNKILTGQLVYNTLLISSSSTVAMHKYSQARLSNEYKISPINKMVKNCYTG